MSQRNEVRFQFHLDRSSRGIAMQDGPSPSPPPRGRVPRVARLMALARRFDGLLRDGTVKSMADLARLGRVTRARITQIMDLCLLAPDVQEALLFLAGTKRGHDLVAFRTMRYVCATPIWAEQRARWAEITVTFPAKAGDTTSGPTVTENPSSVRAAR